MKRIPLLWLLVISPPPLVCAEPLGRLFFTPEQRTQLELEHTRNAKSDGSKTAAKTTVNGIVQHHGGTRTVWINGKAQTSSRQGEPASEGMAVPGKSGSTRIKVGERFSPESAIPKIAPVSVPKP